MRSPSVSSSRPRSPAAPSPSSRAPPLVVLSLVGFLVGYTARLSFSIAFTLLDAGFTRVSRRARSMTSPTMPPPTQEGADSFPTSPSYKYHLLSASSSDSSLRSFPSGSDLAEDEVEVVQPGKGNDGCLDYPLRRIKWDSRPRYSDTKGKQADLSSASDEDEDGAHDDKENRPSSSSLHALVPILRHSHPSSSPHTPEIASHTGTSSSGQIQNLHLTFASSSSYVDPSSSSPSLSPVSPPPPPDPRSPSPLAHRRSKSDSALLNPSPSTPSNDSTTYLDLASSLPPPATSEEDSSYYDSSEEDDLLEDEEEYQHQHRGGGGRYHPFPLVHQHSITSFESDSDEDDARGAAHHIEHSSPSPPVTAERSLPPFTETQFQNYLSEIATRTGVYPASSEDSDDEDEDDARVVRRLAEATAGGRPWAPMRGQHGGGSALGLEGVWEDSSDVGEESENEAFPFTSPPRPRRARYDEGGLHPSDLADTPSPSYSPPSSQSSYAPMTPQASYAPLPIPTPQPQVRYKRVLVDLGLRLTPHLANCPISDLLGEKWKVCDEEGVVAGVETRGGSGLRNEVFCDEE